MPRRPPLCSFDLVELSQALGAEGSLPHFSRFHNPIAGLGRKYVFSGAEGVFIMIDGVGKNAYLSDLVSRQLGLSGGV